MKLHNYQIDTINSALELLSKEKGVAILADPGLGKTVMTLEILKKLGGQTLIVAPLRVIQTVWAQEAKKWGYEFSVGLVHGSPRKREQVLAEEHDIYLINPANIKWLEKEYDLSMTNLVIDESTAFKGWNSQRSKAMRKMVKIFNNRILLTGTPTPNSPIDWQGQAYLLDEGKLFGKTLTAFRKEWCRQGGFQGRQWLFAGDYKNFNKRMAHNTLRLDCNEHLDMPELIVNDIELGMDREARDVYEALEDQLFLQIEGGEIELLSPGSIWTKCRQAAQGFVYDVDGIARNIHSEKQYYVSEFLQELGDKPVLFAHAYREDGRRMAEEFDCELIAGGTKNVEHILSQWNSSNLQRLSVQPAAASHGLNMQYGDCNNIVWLGLPTQSELYTQFNARLWRQGQKNKTVVLTRLVMGRTIEIPLRDALDGKIETQAELLESLISYRRGK